MKPENQENLPRIKLLIVIARNHSTFAHKYS